MTTQRRTKEIDYLDGSDAMYLALWAVAWLATLVAGAMIAGVLGVIAALVIGPRYALIAMAACGIALGVMMTGGF